MKYSIILQKSLAIKWNFCILKRLFSNKNSVKDDIKLIRNIGVLAHIDAGKTTTTERMLFYSGKISNMGEVHHGNTVTDFMDQERSRGITITSAAVTFWWNQYKINLIDTPGHIDFTNEVEQTLQVLDGAIVILDGSAGVEAQTVTVWTQADRHNVPRLVYINKMDRADADIDMCLNSLKSRLGITPLLIQYPIKKYGTKGFSKIIDLVNMNMLHWPDKSCKEFNIIKMKDDNTLLEEAIKYRNNLIEQLADLDDQIADFVIKNDNFDKISNEDVIKAIRRVTLSQIAVPVLCGSSYHNCGVQPLMDSIGLYLPSPIDRPLSSLIKCFNDSLCARVFKVRHDHHLGAITFLRLYSGSLSKGHKLYNLRLQLSEQSNRLMIPYADDFEDISFINNGNICVVSGLKNSNTGDILTNSQSTAQDAKKILMKKQGFDEKEAENILGINETIPQPVFFCSIEPPSQAYQTALEKALKELQREDPSLRVTLDSETGQTILAGMGKLHLEVIKERIVSEYKIDVDLGPMQIAYRETLTNFIKDSYTLTQKLGSGNHFVTITLSLNPDGSTSSQPELKFDKTHESASNLSILTPRQIKAIKKGIQSGMSHGPLLGCAVVGVEPTLHWVEIGRGTSETLFIAALSQCVHKLLKQGGTTLLEPFVLLEIVLPPEYVSTISSDLSHRRANIQQINDRKNYKIIVSIAPLAELLDYSTYLRTMCSGTASFTMEFHSLQPMSPRDRDNAITQVTGFAPK